MCRILKTVFTGPKELTKLYMATEAAILLLDTALGTDY